MSTTEWNPAKLLELSGSYWQTCTLHTGVKLGIFTLLADRKLTAEEAAKEIGKAGRIRIEREFSEKVIVSRLLKIYEIVLEKGNLGFNRE